VELCHWAKKSFASEGNCYKHKFYGISTHQCMEITPTAMNCENRCIYCWRPTEFYDTLEMPGELVDEPDVIVNQLMAERKKLINGYYDHAKNDKKKLDESLLPAHYAISLSGEPTMYPKLPQLIKYLKSLKATKSIFLVTNGQEPDMLKRLEAEGALPTQIYLLTNASNKKMFHQINRPMHRDAWERWWESLRFLATVDTRTVLHMTHKRLQRRRRLCRRICRNDGPGRPPPYRAEIVHAHRHVESAAGVGAHAGDARGEGLCGKTVRKDAGVQGNGRKRGFEDSGASEPVALHRQVDK